MYRARDASTGAVLAERLRPAHTHWTRLKGLLGTRSLAPGDGLWLKPCNQVHMIGMRYAIDVVFLDDKHHIVRAIAGLAPGKISPKVRTATSVLELPEGTVARTGLQAGAQIAIEGGRTPQRPKSPALPIWARCAGWTATFVLVTALLVLIGRTRLRWEKPCPEFICYWAAGTLLAVGHSPYDLVAMAKTQHEYGWDKERDGLGYYDFLPYYYPPSLLGVISVLLVPLGFSTARIAWLVLNTEWLLIGGYILRNAVASVPRFVPMVFLPVFALSAFSVVVGQVVALVVVLMAAAWVLLQRGWDRSAGWVLAWLSIKPQLSTLLVIATLIWLARQRRWKAVVSFAAGTLLLLVLSLWWVPSWPLDIVHDMGQTPLGTRVFPWAGTSWLLLLRFLGAKGWRLWVSYTAVALPFCWVVLRCALRRESGLDEVFALSILAAFFVAPTARAYDEPILIIPLLVLLGTRLSALVGATLVVGLIVLPYVHMVYWVPSIDKAPVQVWFFWIPALLAALWFASPLLRPRSDRS